MSSDHDADVAAVLAEAMHGRVHRDRLYGMPVEEVDRYADADVALEALSDAGYAVVKLPEGLAARLEELLADEHHVIEFANKGWTIAHPLKERLDGSLFDCDAFWDSDDPGLRGRFNLEYDEDGVLVLGARIGDTP